MDMDLNFQVSEEEFMTIFGLLYGMSRSVHATPQHRPLAEKLLSQAESRAKVLLGDEYEAFMKTIDAENKKLDAREVMVLEKISGAKDNN